MMKANGNRMQMNKMQSAALLNSLCIAKLFYIYLLTFPKFDSHKITNFEA